MDDELYTNLLKREVIIDEEEEAVEELFIDRDASNDFSNTGDSYPQLNEEIEFRKSRSNPVWSSEMEEMFIEKIKSYPPLYDHSNENWKNIAVKDVIWEEISVVIGVPANECRRHFKNMRDKFVRYKRTGKRNRKWKVGEAMNFLVEMDLIKHRPPKNPDDMEYIGSYYSEDKLRSGKSDEKSSSSFKNEELNSDNGFTFIRTLRASTLKRKSEAQLNVDTSIQICQKLDRNGFNSPESIPKKSLTNELRLSHIGNGHKESSRLPILPTPQLLLATLSPQISTPRITIDQPKHNEQKNNGPNYFFGQYIASVLDALPQDESLMTRHKLQEILFEAQRKSVSSSSQIIQFQCTNCANIFSPL